MNNSRIVSECRRFLSILVFHLSGSLSTVNFSLTWVSPYGIPQSTWNTVNTMRQPTPPHTMIQQRAVPRITSSHVGDTVMFCKTASLLHSFRNLLQSTWVCHLLRDANLSWDNEESCSTTRLTWPSLDRRWTNQLFRERERRKACYPLSLSM